jgi:signal transduction histidine kinase
MGLRVRWETNMEEFRRGVRDAQLAAAQDPDRILESDDLLDRSLVLLTGVSRVLLFGFLLAYPGVPFLPWGKPWEIATTLMAAAAATPRLHNAPRKQLVRTLAVLALLTVTMRVSGTSSTSMVLIGAFLSTCVSLASNYPFVYGLAAGYALGGVIVQVFGLNIFESPQMLLSGEPFTPHRMGAESLRIAGFMFLAGLIHVARNDLDRLNERARKLEQARDLAVLDERARIARELHDVVSHHVTAMTLQAEAASMTGDRDALASVATAGRDALTELRRMLGVLRRPTDEADDATLEPQPGLADLDRLAERTTAGLLVHVDKRGDVRSLSAGVELCIYRVVQEALTNSTKHSDATKVNVVLSYGADMVTVEIRDDGRPLGAPKVRSAGLGLIGMRERVLLLDGELNAGPCADGNGFEVVARLPVDP